MGISFKFGEKNYGPFGNDEPLFFIAGPCVIESEQHALECAQALSEIFTAAGIPVVYKSSFDKANRSSGSSFRGPGIEAGLEILSAVRERVQMPVLTDVHLPDQVEKVARVADILQIPAFLCRQTDLIEACCATGKPVNIKKGQFMAPWAMDNVLAKARATGNERVFLCERGTSFGYGNLVVDMRGLAIMKKTGAPIIFDATHSVQLPGACGNCSGGEREYVPVLSKAACATGIAGIFMEVHPDPDHAPCDGPNMIPLKELPQLLQILKEIDNLVKRCDS